MVSYFSLSVSLSVFQFLPLSLSQSFKLNYKNLLLNSVLNAYGQNHLTTTRHRCSHVEVVATADLPRFAALNVVADAQVKHSIE
jgi:hypothetical protein